ncbi:erythromycin esterase family protein [Pseudidiomarina insulisalsae]|uniref:Protein-L-isoaspartate O-methyltransferase n=1 Tax=Pseudidiomarina insulisalsae TaxID=575789 RepID=A0A432YCY7_9GAMM|nr:erythromycin esterase family protein [Pseudidiomarina insulisalsae]RUO58726.1 protein-L-isoaspartate O-methyltransferase [Pseudidiomarina insulisalsae]
MSDPLIKIIEQSKHEFSGTDDLAPLLESLADKKIVMLGEASHGTHEYYQWRARISKKLLEEHDFDFVVVEGDWPACYELNRHVKGYADAPEKTTDALKHFERWPTWMWANWEVYEFARWLKGFNQERSTGEQKGFYGLDVYSLWESMDAVMDYLKTEDPQAYEAAKDAMRCFEPYRDEDGQRYALSTQLVPEGCADEVTRLLAEVRRNAPTYNSDREEALSAEQNAHVSKNAERYYRIMARGGESTWNLRDRHMMDTLNRLLAFHGRDAKGIVWAHNTHIGDATFTDMSTQGLFNIGQLAREEYGNKQVALVGFGSYEGSVMAGSSWGAPMAEMDLPAAREGSWEDLCNRAGEQFYLNSADLARHDALLRRIAHRAVGVVYNPRHERYGNYVPTVIPKRYDHFIFFAASRALHALDIKADSETIPDTYPFAL